MNPLPSPDADLHEAALAAAEAIVADIAALVEQESYSRDLPALQQARADLRTLVVERLGEPDDEDLTADGAHGEVLTMTYRGTGSGRVLIVGHYDTVWPTGTLAGWPLTEAADAEGRRTLSGPGIFDMKTGLAQGIWALKLLREASLPMPTVTFLFNGDEEIGSVASRPLIEKAAQDADAVLVLEATADGAVKTGRKGVGIFTVRATGVEAHAGLDPAAGASAIHALAEFVVKAVQVADLGRGTSVNVGLIEGGSGTNVAAGSASAMLDIRVPDSAEMDRVDRELDAVTVSDPRVRIEVEHFWNRPPMAPVTPNPLLEAARESAREIGLALPDVSVGGASDANFVAALGIPVLCGMGAVGGGAHARHEHIRLEAVPRFTALTAGTLFRLVDGLPVPRG
ncbi:Carboxypeptidase G2 precursor [Arthrobacter saudimassiliensis]|uniref:Carboxypeptidase G2 n=1 Tax=Arthrobacter saudimassiliensis TaxID=1461584 RepID=A0A078MTQ5_9MICC|nr:Carboxypeptidase G2 precursor [Arthrobacter saudimassiliensis]